jgi:hypothetical protein
MDQIMKTLIVAALLACASPLAAAQAADTVTIPAPGRSIEAPAPGQIIPMQRDEFQQFAGAYNLANGRTLYLRRVDKHYFARVDDWAEHQIVAIGSNDFVALDRQLSMRIVLRPYGLVDGELLIAMPASRTAQTATAQPELMHIAFR